MPDFVTITLPILVGFAVGFGFLWREMVRRFERLETRLDRLDDVLREHAERLARIETKT